MKIKDLFEEVVLPKVTWHGRYACEVTKQFGKYFASIYLNNPKNVKEYVTIAFEHDDKSEEQLISLCVRQFDDFIKRINTSL